MKKTQDRQMLSTDLRRRLSEFVVSELAFLKISPIMGVMRFDKSGRLTLRYVGPIEKLKRAGDVAY